MAMLKVMKTRGYGTNRPLSAYVPHGFRSSFRDWSGEVSSFPRVVAEMALAHTVENKMEVTYRSGDLFTKITKMMQERSNWCHQTGKATVTPIRLHSASNKHP